MRKKRNDDQAKIEYQEGTGNVFADLGLEDADELFARAQLGFHVYKLLTARKLKQREVVTLLGIKQPEVSHLMNGHFSRFTADKLLDFLKRLDQKVTIQIRPHKPGEPYQEVAFGI
jgi:predicted XRE-type DNA-binding protein